MRSLSDSLVAAQKAGGQPLFKAVFTKTGQTTRTYGVDTANCIISMRHPESEWSQSAQIQVDNSDGTLTALDLTGYTCTISYGYKTSAGDEYSACAPLEVIGDLGLTSFRQGKLVTTFTVVGIFNMMAEDEASVEYAPDSANQDTVKDILTAIANASLACFSHCKNYTITFDSEDSLIDSFIPADYFYIGFKESRLSAFKKALRWTKCKARIEDDSEIHVFNPTISGTTYAYEYNDSVTEHNFFEKSVRNRLVIPNRVYVASHPDQGSYTGNDSDSTSYNALGRYIDQFHRLRVTSNAQCTSIATAILQGYQLGQERGYGSAPLNCGQEVMDYIKITDSAANDTRTCNISYLNRICEQGRFEFEFSFGDPELGGVAGLPPLGMRTDLSLSDRVSLLMWYYDTLNDRVGRVIDIQQATAEDIKTMWDYLMNGGGDVWFRKLKVTEQMIIPVWK